MDVSTAVGATPLKVTKLSELPYGIMTRCIKASCTVGDLIGETHRFTIILGYIGNSNVRSSSNRWQK